MFNLKLPNRPLFLIKGFKMGVKKPWHNPLNSLIHQLCSKKIFNHFLWVEKISHLNAKSTIQESCNILIKYYYHLI